MDEALEDDDFSCISITPSRTGEDRVVKTREVETKTDTIKEYHVETNTDYDFVEFGTQ